MFLSLCRWDTYTTPNSSETNSTRHRNRFLTSIFCVAFLCYLDYCAHRSEVILLMCIHSAECTSLPTQIILELCLLLQIRQPHSPQQGPVLPLLVSISSGVK